MSLDLRASHPTRSLANEKKMSRLPDIWRDVRKHRGLVHLVLTSECRCVHLHTLHMRLHGVLTKLDKLQVRGAPLLLAPLAPASSWRASRLLTPNSPRTELFDSSRRASTILLRGDWASNTRRFVLTLRRPKS